MKKSNRMRELDSLRGIAVLLVILYHYTTRYSELYPEMGINGGWELAYGHYGVQLFFIISGFVIYMTLNKVHNAHTFLVKRVIRLYPAYIVSVILTFLCVSVFTLDNREVSLGEAILNLTMLQGYVPYINHVDGVYWSLTIELSFYIFIAILLFKQLKNKIEIIIPICIIICFGFTFFLDVPVLNFFLRYYLIVPYIHLFILGIIFFLIKSKGLNSRYLIYIVSCLIYELKVNNLESFIMVGSFCLLFVFMINGKLIFLGNITVLSFLGTISYTLYLIHQNIGYIILNYIYSSGVSGVIFISIPLLMSIILAYFITFYVERPLQKKLLVLLNQRDIKKEGRQLFKLP